MTNQTSKSRWAADYRWWLAAAVILIAVAWRVSQVQDNSPSTDTNTLDSFVLQQEQLPEDWSVNYNDSDLLGLSQTSADSCYVDINRRELTATVDAAQLEAEIVSDNRETLEEDNYTFEDLGKSEMVVQTSDGSMTLPSHEYSTDWLDNEVYSRQSLAIVVNGGSYLTINLSCPTDDLNPAKSALQAVEFGA